MSFIGVSSAVTSCYKSMKLLLINDTSTSKNQGCQVTMFMVNRLLSRFFPDAQIDRIFLSTINFRFSENDQADFFPARGCDMKPLAAKWIDEGVGKIREIVEKIRWADLIIINGEGSVLECQLNARVIYMICEIARAQDIPCHLINFTAHVTRDDAVELAKRAFDACATVAVREPLSYYLVRKFYANVRLYPDVVIGVGKELGLEEISNSLDRRRHVLIGGGSATLRMTRGSKLFRNRFWQIPSLEAKFSPMRKLKLKYRFLCDELVAQNCEVTLMGWYRDEWLEEFSSDGVRYEEIDFRRYYEICTGAAINFSGRHHGCVMSAAAGCPFITTTANCFKNFGDRLLYGSPTKIYELERLNVRELASDIKAAVDRSKQHIERTIFLRNQILPFYDGSMRNIISLCPDLIESGILPANPDPKDLEFAQNMQP